MRLSCAVVLALAFVAPLARADAPTPSETAVAREEFLRGVTAARAGRWEDARAAFERANGLYPSPATLLNLAGAQAQTGRIVAAVESYRRLLREDAIGPDERDASAQTLAQLEKRVARARIVVRPEAAPHDTQLDGAALPRAAEGENLPIDPGEHTLVVTRPGVEPLRRAFTIGAGEWKIIDVALPPSPEPAREAPPSSGGVLRSPWFWSAVAVVVAGGAVATFCVASSCGGGGTKPATSGTLGGVKLP